MTATQTQDRPTRDRYEPTQDDQLEYESYLDTLNEPTDPEDADHDEAARVAAWLARHGLDSAPF